MCITTDFYMFNRQENLRVEVMNQGKIREYIVVLHNINKIIYQDATDRLQQLIRTSQHQVSHEDRIPASNPPSLSGLLQIRLSVYWLASES